MTGRAERGMTLTEVLLASVAAVAVVGAVNAMMYTTVRLENDLRKRAGLTEEAAAALAMVHLAKRFEAADRIVMLSNDDIQLRFPDDPAQLDAPAAYHWERYVWDGGSDELRHVADGGCSSPVVVAREIRQFTLAFVNEGLDPPGGTCFPGNRDCNLLVYTLLWDNRLPGLDRKTHEFRSQVASRLVADSDVAAGSDDSGDQLSTLALPPPDVSGC